jgi:hypothetical protein
MSEPVPSAIACPNENRTPMVELVAAASPVLAA